MACRKIRMKIQFFPTPSLFFATLQPEAQELFRPSTAIKYCASTDSVPLYKSDYYDHFYYLSRSNQNGCAYFHILRMFCKRSGLTVNHTNLTKIKDHQMY